MLAPNEVRQNRRTPNNQCRPAEVLEMVTDISTFILWSSVISQISLFQPRKSMKVIRKSHRSGAYRLASLISGLLKSLEVPKGTGMTVRSVRHTDMHNTQWPPRSMTPQSSPVISRRHPCACCRPLRPNAQVSGNILAGARSFEYLVPTPQWCSTFHGGKGFEWTIRLSGINCITPTVVLAHRLAVGKPGDLKKPKCMQVYGPTLDSSRLAMSRAKKDKFTVKGH